MTFFFFFFFLKKHLTLRSLATHSCKENQALGGLSWPVGR